VKEKNKHKHMKQYYFIFCKSDLLLEVLPDGTYTIPYHSESPIQTKAWTHVMNISPMDDGIEVKTFKINNPSEIEDITKGYLQEGHSFEMCPLRQSYYKISKDLYNKAGKCFELIYWDQNSQFCGVCGAPMKMHTDISKRCTNCGKEIWPLLGTAVIVLIHKGNEVLLVRAKNFRSDFYGLVAGFVETGETLEHAVHREVMEETGLNIGNLKYFGSQAWPYPCGLMVGYNADYISGDIHIQKEELARASWFTKDNLPKIPEKLSIARQILDDWITNGPGHSSEIIK
jgi:NAD+ diphosphatase